MRVQASFAIPHAKSKIRKIREGMAGRYIRYCKTEIKNPQSTAIDKGTKKNIHLNYTTGGDYEQDDGGNYGEVGK